MIAQIHTHKRFDWSFALTYLVVTADELLSQSEYDLFVKANIAGRSLRHLLAPYRSSNLRECGHSFRLPDYDSLV